MPDAPRRPHLHHIDGLDGVRAFAVLAVIAFHAGFSWLPGGYYGVDGFFVLSGFLITSLLITEWRGEGTISLGRFWARRARRLLPALFLLVTIVGLVAAIWPSVLGAPHLFAGAVASVFYSANWYFIGGHTDYFSAVGHSSPLLHTWSLAIEEQFYLIWPLVLVVLLRARRPRDIGSSRAALREPRDRPGRMRTVVTGRFRVLGGGELVTQSVQGTDRPRRSVDLHDDHRRLEWVFALASIGALFSALDMAFAANDSTRAYYGTDTRAQALLVGAALAAGFARWGSFKSEAAKQNMALLGLAGVAGTILMWTLVSETNSLAFHGGFLLASLAACAVIAGAVQAPKGPVTRALSWPPIQALGKISYGVYLWYWPTLLVLSPERTGLGQFPLFLVRVAITISLAAVSYRYVEQPIRRGLVLPSWRGLFAAPIAAGVALITVLVATLVPASTTAATAPISNTSTTASVTPGTGTAPPTASTPLKVLLVGDSVAGSLGVGLAQEAGLYNVELINEGAPGCSVAMDQEIKVLYFTLPPGPPCVNGQPQALFSQWKSWVDAFNPDVVVYLARGETFDVQHSGQWMNLGEPSFNTYVRTRFEQAVSILGAKGATVVLMTTPYYDSGDEPTGGPWPEDQPIRVAEDNLIMSAVVAKANSAAGFGDTTAETLSHPTPPASVYDLGSLVSPGGHYAELVGGTTMRCTDGVHFTVAGGVALAPVLFARLEVLGKNHHDTSPTGAWSGTVPAAVPGWYAKLPCN